MGVTPLSPRVPHGYHRTSQRHYMGRIRARFSKTHIDRLLQERVAEAQRSLQDAVRLCRDARNKGGVEGARSRRVERDLAKAISALGQVRRLTPIYDTDDPDLMGEDEKARLYREKQAQGAAEDVVEGGLYITPDQEGGV